MEERRITADFATEVEYAVSDALRGLGLEEGNTVYWVRDKVHKGTIEEICLGDEDGDIKVLDKENAINNEPAGLLRRFYLNDFGRELFFSKEQAEDKLRDLHPEAEEDMER
jgi:hypothetical protein